MAPFKVVAPLSRSANGEVKVNGNQASIHDIIDEPSLAKELTIDGLETSWAEEGIFGRSLVLEKEKMELVIRLLSHSGKAS